jgi:hypothetical protein
MNKLEKIINTYIIKKFGEPSNYIVAITGGGYSFFPSLWYGLDESKRTNSGYIWKPIVYSTCGIGIGVITGLYWKYTLPACVLGDFIHDTLIPKSNSAFCPLYKFNNQKEM